MGEKSSWGSACNQVDPAWQKDRTWSGIDRFWNPIRVGVILFPIILLFDSVDFPVFVQLQLLGRFVRWVDQRRDDASNGVRSVLEKASDRLADFLQEDAWRVDDSEAPDRADVLGDDVDCLCTRVKKTYRIGCLEGCDEGGTGVDACQAILLRRSRLGSVGSKEARSAKARSRHEVCGLYSGRPTYLQILESRTSIWISDDDIEQLSHSTKDPHGQMGRHTQSSLSYE